MDREALVHFIGGAMGGTAGTALTCPLEVVKTRMQSSHGINTLGGGPSTSQGASPKHSSGGGPPHTSAPKGPSSATPYRNILGNTLLRGQMVMQGLRSADPGRMPLSVLLCRHMSEASTKEAGTAPVPQKKRFGTVFRYFAHIFRTEGIGALYKGLIPNLIGVAPSKAVYFYTYSTSKRFWNESLVFVKDSSIVHMISAGSAGFVAASAVNPIWLVKTRLQLHQGKIGIWQMVKRVYQREGVRGFYKGVTASYAGVSETMIQFVIYERLRSLLLRHHGDTDDKRKTDFLNFMVAGGSAKFIACVIAYPHEVVRTRLREESEVKRGFFRTLYELYKEGYRSMYRGLSVQLMRTVPNTAITMGTYEVVVYALHQLLTEPN